MCTAVTYVTKDAYFGRNLDYEFSYGEEVVVMPRNYPLKFRHVVDSDCSRSIHYAMVGVAFVTEGMPLFYDGVNEKGLAMAGLNFVGNAKYARSNQDSPGKSNIPQFEFIPWILSRCATVEEAKALLEQTVITEEPFSKGFEIAELHWIIADRKEAVTVECTEKGMTVFENPVGVLTNNPPFDYQMFSLNNYMSLSPKQPENNFGVKLERYSRGMGGIGLPGDLSSQSRFAKAAYTKLNSVSGDLEAESISQFFHIMEAVSQQRGCCEVAEGKYEITIYTSCCNLDKGIYYYNTYDNHQINAVDMHREDLNGSRIVRYPMAGEESVLSRN